MLKPFVVLVGTPVGVGLGATLGCLGVAAAGVCATLAVPYFIVKLPLEAYRKKRRRMMAMEVADRYSAEARALNGCGITFVGGKRRGGESKERSEVTSSEGAF